MIVYTYQSQAVLRIVQEGVIYRAKPSISFQREYAALIDLLGLKCECPVFGVLQGRRKNTGGKVSGTVRMKLDVPEKSMKLTEYDVWADFIYAMKFSRPGNYKKLVQGTEEVSEQTYAQLMKDLKTQRPPKAYRTPQVVLEKINPKWLKSVRFPGKGWFGK